jgi:flagellar assembly protein FliH
MSKQLQRYDFGTLRDFRGPIVFTPPAQEAVEEAPPPPPPPPVFNEDQLQQARIEAKKLGFNEGFMAGMAQAEAESNIHEKNADKAMAVVAEQIVALSSTYTGLLKQQSGDISELALMIAKKVAGEALDAHNVEVIAALVVRCLPVIFTRPRLVVELHPDTLPKAEQKLQHYLLNLGYEGDLQFRVNLAIGPHDARLDWGTGVAERSTATLWQDIERLLARVPLELEIPAPPTPITPTEITGE